jgi:apolipoprotein N-acyltransferase
VAVDATGSIQPGSPAPYTEGFVVATIPLPERRLTIYTRLGDWFPLLCAALLLAELLLGLAFRSSRRRLRV